MNAQKLLDMLLALREYEDLKDVKVCVGNPAPPYYPEARARPLAYKGKVILVLEDMNHD